MRPTAITANLRVADTSAGREFYQDFLGLTDVAFDLGWVVSLQTPDGRAEVHLVSGDATSAEDSAISVKIGDQVEDAYDEARRRGYEIVHPLTTEEWGVRRFMVRSPDGAVINIVDHADE